LILSKIKKHLLLQNSYGWFGASISIMCHFRVASENAKMGLPEVSLGVIQVTEEHKDCPN
jgi:hypothetical protein